MLINAWLKTVKLQHKKYGERATCETWVEETKSQMGICHIRTGEFLDNCALFQCAVLAYNVMRWMALMGAKVIARKEYTGLRGHFVRIQGAITGA